MEFEVVTQAKFTSIPKNTQVSGEATTGEANIHLEAPGDNANPDHTATHRGGHQKGATQVSTS